MASKKIFIIMGLCLVIFNLVVQSAPIETVQSLSSSINEKKQAVNEHLENIIQSETTSTPTSSSTSDSTTILSQTLSINNIQEKKKRSTFIDQLDVPLNEENDYLNNDDIVDNSNEHVLHANIKETSAQIHDNADKPVDTDDSRVFSDIQMTPFNLKTIRQRRQIQLNEQSTQRHKRALSPYEFFDSDSYYDPYADLMEQQEYDRPMRSFAPLYWYPNVYQRSVRSDLIPSFYESSELPSLYSNTIDEIEDNDDDDESDDNPVLLFDNDNDFESNRYPILIPSSNLIFTNDDLQQQYNADEYPIDEDYKTSFNGDDDDDDGEQYGLFNSNDSPYFSRYGPTDTYF